MNIIKRGVRFMSQETDKPMIVEEVPFIVNNLTPQGLRLAAIASFSLLQSWGYSLNQAIELLGGAETEAPKEIA